MLARKKFTDMRRAKSASSSLAMFLGEATLIEITEEVRACRDPKDDKFWSWPSVAMPATW